MLIDCDSCAVRNLACGDCVVTVLLGMPAPATASGGDSQPAAGGEHATDTIGEQGHAAVTRVELDNPERAAIAVLAAHGLVPPLRLVPRDDAAGSGDGAPAAPGDDPRAAAG